MNCKYWPWSNENDKRHEYRFPLLKEDIKVIFGSLHYINSFTAMRDFAHALSYGVKFETECEMGEEFLKSELYLNITDICRSREMYSIFLKYIGEKYNNVFFEIADELSCIATDWIALRNLILKAYYRKEKIVKGEKLYEMATQISIREEKLALLFKDTITSGDSNVNMPKIIAKPLSKISHITYVNLELYLNNKGIINKGEERKYADLSGIGEYILPVSEPIPPILEHDRMKFKICWGKYANDNIVCLGQTINIPVGKYECIMIAGTATWGNCNTDIILNYKCSDSERLRISVPDWQFGKMPDVLKDVIWYGLGEKRMNNNFEPLVERYIYAFKYFIKLL